MSDTQQLHRSMDTTRPLLDILGARWRVGTAAGDVDWDAKTGLAGFALNDGTLALAHPVWEGAPELRPRPGGGAELVAGTAVAPPAARVKAHRNACTAVAADPDGGFLSGGADGRVVGVQADGQMRAIAHLDRAVGFVVAGAGRWRACAAGSSAYRLGGAASRVGVGSSVSSLAVEPSGARLAIGHEGGVTLWAGGDTPRILAAPGVHRGLCWSADGTLLASFTADGVINAWRLPGSMPVTHDLGEAISCLGVLPATTKLVAGIGGRVVCWPVSGKTTLDCGVPNQSAVTRIACHPRRPLLAAGYANGTVVLCRSGSRELLLLRGPGQGAVSALRFAAMGDRLAIGTDGGEIAVLAMPDLLFRDQAK